MVTKFILLCCIIYIAVSLKTDAQCSRDLYIVNKTSSVRVFTISSLTKYSFIIAFPDTFLIFFHADRQHKKDHPLYPFLINHRRNCNFSYNSYYNGVCAIREQMMNIGSSTSLPRILIL